MREEEFMRYRAEHCVCKQCGGKLEEKVIVYNKYGGAGLELYCPKCHKIEYGTDPHLYQLASEFTETMEFDYFTEMTEDEHHDRLNTAKVCEILGWIFRRAELLDEKGLKIDLDL